MYRIVYLIGSHGTGKTTIGKSLADNFSWEHLSVGDLGRNARRNFRVPGISIRLLSMLAMEEPGSSISQRTAKQLISEIENKNTCKNMVCDGFPSHPNHINMIQAHSEIILIQTPEELRQQRLSDRVELTGRKWTPGKVTIRDDLLASVFLSAQQSIIVTSVIENGKNSEICEIANRIAIKQKSHELQMQ